MTTTLRIIREPSRELTTLGALYINDRWRLWTLEDAIREVPGQPVASWKVPGETAIPAGHYEVRLTRSARFGVVTPEILAVQGYTGIRMHWGNKRQDTEGCVIVGRHRDDVAQRVTDSRLAFGDVMAQLVDVPGPIWLVVENPPSYQAAT